MAVYSFDDLISRPILRTAPAKVAGWGEVVLNEPTAADRWKIAEEVEEAGEASPELFARWVLRSIKKWDDVTNEEVQAFCNNVGDDVIGQLFKQLCQFSLLTVDDAKKN